MRSDIVKTLIRSIKLVTCILVFVIANTYSQDIPSDTSYWKSTGLFGINLSQVGLSNWAGGGESSIAIGAAFNYEAKHEKNGHMWINRLNVSYGIQRLGGKNNDFRKTDDKLILFTQYGKKISGRWYTTTMGDFRTQLTVGNKYDKDDNKTKISNFLAPGFLKLGIGLTYKHNYDSVGKEYFSFTAAPITGKITFVTDDALFKDLDGNSISAFGVAPGKHSRAELGANFEFTLHRKIMKNITLHTNLSLFTPYEHTFGNFDANWEALLQMKVNKYISASLSGQLIYDDDIRNDIQLKNVLAIGFAYAF